MVAQTVKRLPAMWETWVRSLGRENPQSRKWQPTPVLLPAKTLGWRSLIGYSPWAHKESDMTEQLSTSSYYYDLVCRNYTDLGLLSFAIIFYSYQLEEID